MEAVLADFLIDTHFGDVKLGASESIMSANNLVPFFRAANDNTYKFKGVTLEVGKPIAFSEALIGFDKQLLRTVLFVSVMDNFETLLDLISNKYGAPMVETIDEPLVGNAYKWRQNNIQLELCPRLHNQCHLKYSLNKIIYENT